MKTAKIRSSKKTKNRADQERKEYIESILRKRGFKLPPSGSARNGNFS